jgi:HSP20 family protein
MTTTTQKPNGASIVRNAPARFNADEFVMPSAWIRRMLDWVGEPQSFLREFATGVELPAVDLYEKDGSYVLECALPGFKKDDIKVEASDGAVTISGSYSYDKNDQRARYHRREMGRSSFSRTVELPQQVDYEKASATFSDGVLKLVFNPVRAIASKTIPINS